ncbi:hypothetical protein RJ492_004550 [Pluralibacter gergoviae]|uniref:hypothetical protein n=1 Tax=Enterobacterales TaxID=91347 RepID=UPI0007CC129C|nr:MULTISPECIES: hypothetical protein [Enterobacterales]EKV9909490.1 hypothetical protein [Pluralibacter gergoviae]SAQ02994.1 Uncharacterised protein [Klebsiella oxytoca]HBX4000092.1 hypothetical protein [Klebsiella variicola]ELD4333543.1 hypothetical protein [Pluralibacter gergoviae]MBZ6860881.1 hypothetical protein [Klebsiella michiganensis]
MNIEQLIALLNEQRQLIAPAPWAVLDLYGDAITVVDANGFEHLEIPNVAIVPDWEKLGLQHWSDEGGSREVSLEEQKANAQLAIAAPLLLAHINVLNGYVETAGNALRRMLNMYELMMVQANHADSFYDAECLQEMAEAPLEAAAVLEYLCGDKELNVELKGATCIGCGCTDGYACVDENRMSCSWLKVNRETGLGVCSHCPAFLNHSLTADGDKPEVRHD